MEESRMSFYSGLVFPVGMFALCILTFISVYLLVGTADVPRRQLYVARYPFTFAHVSAIEQLYPCFHDCL